GPLLLMIFLSFSNHPTKKSYPFKVEKVGQGTQSVILIPGFASSGEVWESTTDQLKDKFTCYTLTMPGFAGVKPQPDPSFKKWETAIADFIKTENIKNPSLIGHSMGGGLALALAADYPDLIKKIVVVDALPSLAAMNNPS